MELIRTFDSTPMGVIHLGLIGQFHYQALQKLNNHYPTNNPSSTNKQLESTPDEQDKEFIEDRELNSEDCRVIASCRKTQSMPQQAMCLVLLLVKVKSHSQ